ncbi:ribbon-helix-helix domain-containing protein (plasmid) [Paracoccus denitrificans]|uniref:ribbon-helix-helix domain-containing protein n=1 Tax=Paracoccus denitrificans TaxID=266 RepID=UPI001E4BAE3E|nr:ribbon-helix-helix domain-containing protein [Paracoccus denitrificans]UFS68373.1 ribbon-helix-helix domain-containing protein [Paracoccus denitrificans]
MCEVFSRQDPRRYQPVTRKLRLNGQSTSIRLEQAFWDILDDIAAGEGMATPAFLSTLQTEVLQLRGEPVNFTSLLRCACLVQLERRGSGAGDFRQAAQRVAQAA